MKYYWSLWLNNRGTFVQKISEHHPFSEIDNADRKDNNGIWILLNYKEITKEEYEIFSEKTIGNYNYCEPDLKYYTKMIKYEML